MAEHAPVDRSHPAFRENAAPFYSIVREGLGEAVDGEHFWDTVAEDAVFEFRYVFTGFGPVIEGRQAYMDWFGGYDMQIRSADGLCVYQDEGQGVVTLEYEVHGTTISGGRYDNRFCSIVTIRDRKIVYWRDYMDSLAVVNALGGN
ncbi:MAG: nuclear transport factor 2 family protein [Actinomycetota bacterium]